MLAPAELRAGDERATERADIVVGVHGGPDPEAAAETVERVREILAPLAQARPSRVVVLSGPGTRRGSSDGTPVPTGEPPRLAVGSGPLTALLATAQALDASACALVTAGPREGDGGYLGDLLGPVLHDGYDLVWPLYRRHKFEGGLHVALARPFARAVFGTGLRQPITTELAFSRRVVEFLSDDRELHEDANHATGETLLAAHGVARSFAARGFQVGQSVISSVPAPSPGGDVSDTVARIAGLLFDEARRHAMSWQRVRGAAPVAVLGSATPFADDPRPLDASRMYDAFVHGYRELHRIWAPVLPPATLLGLKRATALPAHAFRIDPPLWARVVYDFAVGYHTSAMERRQLLRSMTPLYLGWMASWVNEVRDLRCGEVEEHADGVCRAFDAERPYFMSRWRWPDRFAP